MGKIISEARAPAYVIHKKKLKTVRMPTCESRNHKNPRRKQAADSQTSLEAIISPIHHLRQEKKNNLNKWVYFKLKRICPARDTINKRGPTQWQ